jgi:GNAT superfamily N-acetyltransferase
VGTTTMTTTAVSVDKLDATRLDIADRTLRVAFGTFLGVPEPPTFFGDADYVSTRFGAPNTVALEATTDGELAGTNFVTAWGAVGFFGPLSVRIDLWDRGIASALMEATMDVFSEWGTKHAALFTWADSAKHHGLYQKFGFYPTFLTAIMSKPVRKEPDRPLALASDGPDGALEACRRVADAIYPGLDLSGEIRSVLEQKLGDVVLLDPDEPAGFAICHVGSGTEAGSGACFAKFAAVHPGPGAPERFASLIDACEAFAAERGAERLVAGQNMGRLHAYRSMLARGFRTELTGVAMQQAGEHGYNRPDAFVIDDWR